MAAVFDHVKGLYPDSQESAVIGLIGKKPSEL